MPKYNLDKTWELCLAQWAWIRKQIEAGALSEFTINALKHKWLKDNGFESIQNRCFFCDYTDKKKRGVNCTRCPGRLVDSSFHCSHRDYSYYYKPLAFCDKLLELNAIRSKK